jgi:hypothetical protein
VVRKEMGGNVSEGQQQQQQQVNKAEICLLVELQAMWTAS